MTPERYTPDEFARLMALPDGHPDRQSAEQSAQFRAWRLMLREFEQPEAALASPSELESAAREVEARVARALTARAAAGAEAPRHRTVPHRALVASLVAWFRRPAMRPALAVVAVVLVAGVALWSSTRGPATRAVRGPSEASSFVLNAPRAVPGGIELTWTPVPDAEAYRVVFYGTDLQESARVDGLTRPGLLLHADALPAGLPHGGHVMAEVTALRHGDPIVTSASRLVRLP